MDVEIASITQLTNSVQLAEPPNLHAPPLENDSDAGMDLDGENDPSKHFSSTRSSGIDVILGGIPKWGQDAAVGTHTQMGDSWSSDSEYEALATSGEAVLASRITLLPTALVSDSRDVLHAIFESMENHEDDADDSEWLDSEDDDEMLSGDEVVLAVRSMALYRTLTEVHGSHVNANMRQDVSDPDRHLEIVGTVLLGDPSPWFYVKMNARTPEMSSAAEMDTRVALSRCVPMTFH
ncbi:hypothetical protein DFH94DRAFT_679916 [Russula ochroleuca]|uniref:Uncharacterized protein n=1 Tax=Russula ochroleuca TaxID=152965 RepID=A0A9P5N0E0_9AGAM|nr:hypothetical protein DFH94DRAFT_679916 [Russula ochroleuca]